MAFTILIVDDSATARLLSCRCLEKVGFRGALFCEAENGAQALAIVRGQPVDLIVTDLDMPVMNGHDLCQNLHQDGSAVPVFVLSATADAEDRTNLTRQGVREVLRKPAFPAQFKSALKEHIDAFRLTEFSDAMA